MSSASVAVSCIVRRVRQCELESVWRLAAVISTAAHWSLEEYEKYCAAGRPGDTLGKALFVAVAEGRIVGLAAYSTLPAAGESTLENIAVAERWRRQGIAKRLLTAGRLWCRTWPSADPSSPAAVGLEVRASNRDAIAFYESAGFVAIGPRHRYYAQPEEDAVLLALPLDVSWPPG